MRFNRKTKWRIFFSTALLLVLVPISHSIYQAVSASRQASRPSNITISMMGFNPGQITIPAGKPVTLHFINPDNTFHTDGGGWHEWANSQLGIDIKIPPETTKDVAVTIPKKGQYDFVCTICCGGAANPSMHMEVIAS